MAEKQFTPYVPASADMAELTFKAIFLGVLMAIVLGAANAYVGMRAGLTVAATFPAAVVAMTILRPFRGTILEENTARTAASVGEALVAGAVYTIPAFLISGVWDHLHYWESMMIMMVGGVLGVLFVVLLRRALVVEADLPFPESAATAELTKAGQDGQSGASYVFGAMGLAAVWELLKNGNGIPVVQETLQVFRSLGHSSIALLGKAREHTGGLLLSTSAASPMLMGVGFIVGPRVAAVLFSGAVMGWLVLVPLAFFLNPALSEGLDTAGLQTLATAIWRQQIRPLTVGTMIVAAFYTLYKMRSSLSSGIRKALADINLSKSEGETVAERTQLDLDFHKIFVAIAVMVVATFFLYHYFTRSIGGALLLTIVLVIFGFLFSAVAAYLVGLIGSSNNPISGLTLSALLISALLMAMIGLTDVHGVAAALGVAGVVCCAAGIAGDMVQDLKVGHLLGGTPWRMQVGEIIGVIVAALALPLVLMLMHHAYGIGSETLSAPQAGLMALMAKGIVGGEMAWPLVIVGMFLAIALIMIDAPSPMLIAVGMYLPFFATSAIFVGGVIKWLLQKRLAAQKASDEEKGRAENVGILISSGFIAGESLMAVGIALLVLGADFFPDLAAAHASLIAGLTPNFWLGLLIYPVVVYLLAWLPVAKMRDTGLAATKVD